MPIVLKYACEMPHVKRGYACKFKDLIGLLNGFELLSKPQSR